MRRRSRSTRRLLVAAGILLAGATAAVPALAMTTGGAVRQIMIDGQTVTGVVAAGPGDNVITGSPTADTINGGPGADTVNSASGADVVTGGSGDDTLHGGPGNDNVAGGPGADTISGGSGADTVNGGPGGDAIVGGPGPDVLTGGPGPDTITCGPGADTVFIDATDTLQQCTGDTIVGAAAYSQTSPMSPRLQWNANDGYCGETSFIMAGMTFGQYTSQWTARALAAPTLPQTNSNSQLMLTWPPGDWQTAATAMRLQATGFNPTQYEDAEPYADVFLSWIKNQFLSGARVIIGMFNNVDLLGEDPPGDNVFDHIVPVMAIGSSHPLVVNDDPGNAAYYDQTYYGDDQITIADNGLWDPFTSPPAPNWGSGNTANNPQGSALYTATFDGVQLNRQQANQFPTSCEVGGNFTNACSPFVYSIYDNHDNLGNYGVAITGIVDTSPGGPFVAPVSLAASVNNEGQQNQASLTAQPASQPMTLTATVTIPDAAKAYTVYEYTSFANVPTGSFNAAAKQYPGNVARTWTIPAGYGATWSKTISAQTGGTYVFRAVPTDAP